MSAIASLTQSPTPACSKCGRRFRRACDLRRHEKRKTPCSPIVEPSDLPPSERAKPRACHFCGRRYKFQTGVDKHLRVCPIAGTRKGLDLLYDHTLKKQLANERERREHMEGQLADLRRQFEAFSAAPSPPTLNLVMNQTININVFGEETLDHIDSARVRALLDQAMATAAAARHQAAAALVATATLIYGDPRHPENITCYLSARTDPDAMVRVPQGWSLLPCHVALPTMAGSTLDVLFGKQPFESPERYEKLMGALREAQPDCQGLRTVLLNNRDLLQPPP